MKKIYFIYPKIKITEIYLNPIDVQRIAGYIADILPSLEVNLIDQNISSFNNINQQIFDTGSIICLALPDGSLPNAIESISNRLLSINPWLILFGEIISDGNIAEVLNLAFKLGFDKSHTIAIIGKQESHYAAVVLAICHDRSPIDLPNVVSVNNEGYLLFGNSFPLQEQIEYSKPLFTKEIYEAVNKNGLRILVDGLSRGCEHHCLYCHLSNSKQTSGIVQEFLELPTKLLKSMEKSLNKETTLIQFTDENFFGGKTDDERRYRLQRIIEFAIDLQQKGFYGKFGIDTRVDTIFNLSDSPEINTLRSKAFNEMSKVGLCYVYLGIESFSRSQLKRYGKSDTIELYSKTIDKLRELKINFTVGLIIFDPLVSVDEIVHSIKFIEKMNLYANVASLLKEMRVQTKAKYYQLLERKVEVIHDVPRDSLKLLENGIPYKNPKIRNAIAQLRFVHNIFVNNGYRHSDVAAFESLLPETMRNYDLSIPCLIAKMEIELLRKIFVEQNTLKSDELIDFVRKSALAALSLNSERERIDTGNTYKKIHDYYSSVFLGIYKCKFDKLF